MKENQNLIVGSDDEVAIRKVIEKAFPKCTQVLCTRHLRKNAIDYMTNTAAVERKDRHLIVDLIWRKRSFMYIKRK